MSWSGGAGSLGAEWDAADPLRRGRVTENGRTADRRHRETRCWQRERVLRVDQLERVDEEPARTVPGMRGHLGKERARHVRQDKALGSCGH